MDELGRMDELEPLPGNWSRALAVVAHPDDLEYGAVAVWTGAGKYVRYLLVTRGEADIATLPPVECARVREGGAAGSRRSGGGVSIVEYLAQQGLPPWSGVRYVAVAGSPEPTHALDVSAVMDRAVESLAAHDAYLTALGDHPMAQPREFLAWWPSSTGPGSAAGRPRCSRCSVC